MKPSLLRYLPPVFRVIERLGLSLPRRFFTRASEYNKVPGHLKDDDVLPNVSEIPSLLASVRHPRRRAVSIGPQSEADAYETLAYREQRRRESTSSDRARSPSEQRQASPASSLQNSDNFQSIPTPNDKPSPKSGTKRPLELGEYEHAMATGNPLRGADTGPMGARSGNADNAINALEYARDERDEHAMFSMITRPRVRYDVEVVTKLIVYSGIAWLSVEGNPILFNILGLSPKDVR